MHKTLKTQRGRRPSSFGMSRLPLAVAICFAVSSTAFAQDAAQAPAQAPAQNTPTPAPDTTKDHKTLDTVTVTAQKRSENPQKVPISLDVLGTAKLEQLNVKSFDDYVKYLPTVSFDPSTSQVYMRGVADGGDGNHSGPLPTVGIYLDEEPITTIDGAVDLHVYDIARVESLAGPQGTLYGASSESGTIRIITNKPDPKAFSGSVSFEADTIDHGGIGNVEEGYVNIPFNDHTAIRIVLWNKHDAGFIDNVVGSRTYVAPGWPGTVNNGSCTSSALLDCTDTAKNKYNTVDTKGARAALQIDLNDNWTITPTVITQRQESHGAGFYDPQVGYLQITHFYPESAVDNWVQAALTVQGKVGNFDVTYAFSHLNREEHASLDYSDYSFWYDALNGSGQFIQDNAGNLINPSQTIQSVDGFTKTSHEFRIASPSDWRLNFVGGLFWQVQQHQIQQDYIINGLATSLSVPNWPNTIWLTEQTRTDRDDALFGEATYDITDKLKATVGAREFHVDNSLVGFFGFGSGYSTSEGTATCFTNTPYRFAPCEDLNKTVKETNHVEKVNLTYQIDPSKMIYATYSQGFRPGGINRNGNLPPYQSDTLDNLEFGWKTAWFDNRLRWNGAAFDDKWKNFQFAVLGQSGLTDIKNANQAEIRGLETNLTWKATDDLEISGGGAYYDAKLTQTYCGITDALGNPITVCPVGSAIQPSGPQAYSGARLPITPKIKANLIARDNFNVGSMDSYFQAAVVHVGERTSDLRIVQSQLLGNLPAYTTVDFSTGLHKDNWSLDATLGNAFNTHAQLSRFTECDETVCAAHSPPNNVPSYPNGQVYVVPAAPRTFTLRYTRDFD
jgi:iron complex outermembrane receptor protein